MCHICWIFIFHKIDSNRKTRKLKNFINELPRGLSGRLLASRFKPQLEIFGTVRSEQFVFWRFNNNWKTVIFAKPRISWESAAVIIQCEFQWLKVWEHGRKRNRKVVELHETRPEEFEVGFQMSFSIRSRFDIPREHQFENPAKRNC